MQGASGEGATEAFGEAKGEPMLEQKVQELLGVSAEILADQEAAKTLKKEFNAELEALPGASGLVSAYEQKAKALDAKSIADNTKGSKLKEEILSLMTEKTHKLECATISKRVTRKLKVLDGQSLYERLRVLPAVLAKITYSFTRCKVIDLVDAGAFTLGEEAEITTNESLVVKKTQLPPANSVVALD
jgi:hypothetical protein